jgi:hypothetical protein
LAWSIYGTIQVLKSYPEQTQLKERYQNYFNLMARTSMIVFYEGNGKIRTVAKIKDVKRKPFVENYSSENPCSNPCYLGFSLS